MVTSKGRIAAVTTTALAVGHHPGVSSTPRRNAITANACHASMRRPCIKRLFQTSLRAVCVGVTVLCVLLGMKTTTATRQIILVFARKPVRPEVP